jgi:hypothetical protein
MSSVPQCKQFLPFRGLQSFQLARNKQFKRDLKVLSHESDGKQVKEIMTLSLRNRR